MDNRLYYCEPWPHKKILVNNQNIDICVSSRISGNQTGTTIQYHGIIHQDYKVYYIGTLNKHLTIQEAHNVLEAFEVSLRTCLKSKIQWMENVYDSEVVKIWYYDEKDTEKVAEDKRLWPPLRFAITVTNIRPIEDNTDKIIQSELEQRVIEWVKSIFIKP
jgi:hypothetical protein